MKRQASLKALFVAAIVVTLSATLLWAQKSTNIGPKYDAATELTVKGTVEEAKIQPGAGEGVHLILKSGTEDVLVHVAPETFMKEMEINFAKGDQLEIRGSKIKNAEGQDEVLAREITKGSNSLTLRDKKGVPVWSMWDPSRK